MKYVSTRGSAPTLDFEGVLLAGLATDGGLYVPQEWPAFSAAELRAMRGLSYVGIAERIMRPFLGGAISDEDFARIVRESYASFDHKAVTPLKQLDQNFWLLELFHGPTLAFKDVALQLLGRLFDHVLTKRGERVTIVGATSGDTGSAAIEACRDRSSIDIFILHPKGRTSEVQRRQMTSVLSSNVHNIALEGTFDDCQDQVKAMFNDPAFRARQNLSAVNSINWARIMAQIVYYFAAGVALGAPDRRIAFSVPTGNFGNVYAAYAAKQMGLPVEKLIVGSNRNDILTRFFQSGEMKITGVEPSLSPSMDIQVSSNFERLLFDLAGRDGAAIAGMMAEFDAKRAMTIPADMLGGARDLFSSASIDGDAMALALRWAQERGGQIIDPHSAVGLAAARALDIGADVPIVTLATAHPAKFREAVERATGVRPPLPARLGNLFEREERYTKLPGDYDAVKAFILAEAAHG